MKISIVTPIYNEEETLPTLFNRFQDVDDLLCYRNIDHEFILVNDGSTDRSLEMLQKQYQGNGRFCLVDREQNGGFGAALRTGIEAAKGEYVVTCDADTNYDQRDIPTMIKSIQDGVDMVTGSIFAKDGEWNYAFHRFLLSQAVVKFYHYVLRGKGQHIATITCGFRVYRRDRLMECLPEAKDFLATAEILVRFLLKDYHVVEFPCVNYERKFGVSKLRTFKTIKSHLTFLWKIYKNRLS